jgi:prevent-host-death family protein
MKKASIAEAKKNLSSLIDGLKGGSPVLIVDRGRPVARLEPVTTERRSEDDGRLDRLVRDGIVRPARAAVPKALFATKPPRHKNAASAVRALVDDRRTGR